MTDSERIAALEAKVATLEKSTSVWQGISGWFQAHPAFAHLLYAAAYGLLGAVVSYFAGLTTVTKEVPGPERVIVKEIPAASSKQKADSIP